MSEKAIILAVESSCDETAAAVCEDGKILSNIVATQAIHREYGGVVPEVAARLHIEAILPVVDKALHESGITLSDVTAFAYTKHPGLTGGLLVGASFIRALAFAMRKKVYPVNHIYAHILANLIDNNKLRFPFLCLSVSGGHTQIILAKDVHIFEIVGETLDDAAGEAFDKIAKMLGLGYPGGALIDKWAQDGDSDRFSFPFPKMKSFDYSFSGLKTAVLYFLEKGMKKNQNFIQENKADICASVQFHIVNILLHTFFIAVEKYKITDVCLAGGVAANRLLRKKFIHIAQQKGLRTHIPEWEYCTDNAAMIAVAAYYQSIAQNFKR